MILIGLDFSCNKTACCVLKNNKLDLSEVCYMGDDINDIPAIDIAGFSVAPPNAHSTVLKRVDFITQHLGGFGAVRELLDMIVELRTKNK